MSEAILRLTQVVQVGDERRPRRAALVVPWDRVECLEAAARKDLPGANAVVRLLSGVAFNVAETVEQIVESVPGVRVGPVGFQGKEKP